MKTLCVCLAAILLSAAAGNASDAPRLIDTDGPTHGVQPLALEEEGRVGGEDEDVIFGRIADVVRDDDGAVCILDNQLCRVMVFSADGEHVGDLGREGDGPGESHANRFLALCDGDCGEPRRRTREDKEDVRPIIDVSGRIEETEVEPLEVVCHRMAPEDVHAGK